MFLLNFVGLFLVICLSVLAILLDSVTEDSVCSIV